MQLIGFFLIILSANAGYGVESISQQTYSNLNSAFNLDQKLKSKVANVGIQGKILNFSNGDVKKNESKVDKGFLALKSEFTTKLEKNFTKDELAYLDKVFSHPLLSRLIKFQNDFSATSKNDKLILDALKK